MKSARFSDMHLFRAALTEALDKTGLTAIALAAKADVTRSRISEFLREKDPTLPKDETLVALCNALPAEYSARIAQAWVRERLGSTLSDAILASASTAATGSDIEKIYSSLPTNAANAFRLLMELSREDSDLRQSIISLAAFAEPETPFQITQIIGPDTPTPQSSTSQEISEATAPTAESPSSTTASPSTAKTAKVVKLRTHIISRSDQRVAEDPPQHLGENGTEG